MPDITAATDTKRYVFWTSGAVVSVDDTGLVTWKMDPVFPSGFVGLSADNTWTERQTIQLASAGLVALRVMVVGDTSSRFYVDSNGILNFGPGNAVQDVNLYRTGANILKTDDAFVAGGEVSGQGVNAYRLAVSTSAFYTGVTGEFYHRWHVDSSGVLSIGSGSAARDVNLYRSAANVLKTDDSLIVGANLYATGPRPWYDVVAYGADPTGTSDCVTAVQAAIDAAEAASGGCVFFPPGTYRFNSGLTITTSNVTLMGSGRGSTLLFPYQTTGDFLYINGATVLQRDSLRDLTIYSQAEATSGALVHFDRCNHARMSNVELAAYFGGLHLESVAHSDFTNVDLTSDANFTSAKVGSYLLKISKHASGVNPSELHFTNCDWRGQDGNNHLYYAVLITALDGAFFTNVHAGFCRYAFYLAPEGDTTQLSGVSLSNFFLDGVQNWGLLAIEPSASYTGVFGAHVFNGGHVYNTGDGGMGFNIAATAPTLINAVEFQQIDTHGIQISQGNYIHMSNLSMWDINEDDVGAAGVRVETGVEHFSINGLVVRKGGGVTPVAAVDIASGCDHYRTSGIAADECTYAIADNSATPDKFHDLVLADLAPLTVAANASLDLDLPFGYRVFKLDPTYDVDAISGRSAFTGRTVTLIATAQVWLKHTDTGNLKVGWDMAPLEADQSVTLTYDGTSWVRT